MVKTSTDKRATAWSHLVTTHGKLAYRAVCHVLMRQNRGPARKAARPWGGISRGLM